MLWKGLAWLAVFHLVKMYRDSDFDVLSMMGLLVFTVSVIGFCGYRFFISRSPCVDYTESLIELMVLVLGERSLFC